MKKVLAWAVVLALVLSSFTMAFADQTKTSKDFKDGSQIQYTEAVDVMVATGVINGYPDGTFGPAKTVKRAEMAKMIAVMMNGGEDIGDQYKSACPFKDSKSHWAAGYIAYCASEHIIDGRSADVFDPEAEVTGTEVAKMALTSLGYDSKIQGYTGETWAAAVLKDAKKVGLFEGLDKSFVPGDPCNRESAAQILFNALQAQEVTYPASINVNTGDAEVNVSTGLYYGDQLYKDVFDKSSDATLEKKIGEAAKDDFGRPGHSWKCEGDDVGTYPDPVDYEFTVEDATSVAKAIEAYDKELAKTLTPNKYNFAPTLINGQASEAIALGDKVELYVTEPAEGTDAPGKVDVIVVQYKPAQITKVDTKKIKPEDAEKGITAYLTLDGDATVKAAVADNTMPGYDESTYVEKAVIAVAVGAENKVLDSYVPEELVAGTITKIKNSTYTIDGTDYNPTGSFKAFGGNLEVKGDYTVYDYNDYMFASVKGETPAAEKFYGVIVDKKTDTNSTGWSTDVPETKQLVRIFTAEGQMEEFTLAENENLPEGIVTPPATDGGSITVTPTLVSYEKNENGEIKAIAKATAPNPADSMSNKAMANNGILYGREVADDVVAFANVGTDKPEWKVYDFAALEKAEKVNISAYIDENGAALLAMMVSGVETPVSDEVMAIVTSVEPITNEDGAAYEIKAFVNGEEQTLTTRKIEKNNDQNDPLDTICKKFVKPAELAMLTMKDGKVESARAANCKGVAKVDEEFGTGIEAVFYGTGNMAINNKKAVIGIDGSSLNVGTNTSTGNDFQACTGAKVYFVNDKNEVAASDFETIEEGNLVVLMKLNKDSATWDTVFFMEAPKTPAGGTTVEPLP